MQNIKDIKGSALNYVLYHKNCNDGFGAAWVAWQALGNQAKYIPVQHGDLPPDIPDGSTVTIADFAYSRDVLLGMYERMESLWVLDHHKTAAQDLTGLEFTTFDMDKSGAMLAWENSAEVTAALSSYPTDFDVWNTLSVDGLAKDGMAIQRAINIQVLEHVEMATIRNVAGYLVPVVNATCYTSEIGGQLNASFPDSPFSAMYFDLADGNRKWSLRSRGEFDVSAIAQTFGGGGHKNSAGYIELMK